MSDASTESTRFKGWYDKKGDDLNADRRKKYAEDDDVSTKAKEDAKAFRQRRADGEKIEQVRYRTLNDKTVEVFTTGYISDRIGVSSQTIVNWSRRGWIPPCTFEESHRLYTKHQIAQIRRIAKSSRDSKSSRFLKMLDSIKTNWSK